MPRRKVVPVPRTKKEAASLVGEIVRLDRQIAANIAAHQRVAEQENRPLVRRREQFAEALAGFGEDRLPADGPDGVIVLGKRRKMYRERSEAVVFTRSAQKIVEDLKARPFWRRTFLKRKVSYSVLKDAVKLHRYIIGRVDGVKIVRRNGLYLQKGVASGEPETLSLIEVD